MFYLLVEFVFDECFNDVIDGGEWPAFSIQFFEFLFAPIGIWARVYPGVETNVVFRRQWLEMFSNKPANVFSKALHTSTVEWGGFTSSTILSAGEGGFGVIWVRLELNDSWHCNGQLHSDRDT